MSEPKLLKALVDKYLDGDKSTYWQHKQSGQWLIKHSALEVVAAKAGIEFDAPIFVETDAAKSVAMVVTGRLHDQILEIEGEAKALVTRTEWSMGEASPANNKMPYPYSMAEKRGKDRVVLKLMNLHGVVYSEDEADDFKEAVSKQTSKPASDHDMVALFTAGLMDCETGEMLKAQWADIIKAGYSTNVALQELKDMRKQDLGIA